MIGPRPGFKPGQTGWLGPGPAGRLFLRPPTLTAGNFAALWPTDPKFLALKNLNPFETVSKVQKTSSISRVGFALSKWPHLHRAYVVGGCLFNFGTVSNPSSKCIKISRGWQHFLGRFCPHLRRAYLVTVRFILILVACLYKLGCNSVFKQDWTPSSPICQVRLCNPKKGLKQLSWI